MKFVAILVGCALALGAPAAQGATSDIIAPSDPENPQANSGWQAGTCTEEPPESTELCSVDTEDQFFKRAAAHPNWGFTQFIVRSEAPGETPVGELKTVRVDLPVGLSVNPGATERCPLETFEAGAAGCPPGSQVGESFVTVAPLGVPLPPTKPLSQVPVYNVVPKFGEPARFGLELAENEVFLEADVEWAGDYHEGFTIQVPRVGDLEPLIKGLVLRNRLVFNGRSGDGTFITTPGTCLGEAAPGPSGTAYSTYLLAVSHQEAEVPGYEFPADAAPPLESRIPPGTEPEECPTIPYDPSLDVGPGTTTTDSPAGATVAASVPHIVPPDPQDEVQESSHTRRASVALPTGMALNPSAANGLKACDEDQFGKGTKTPVACPTESKVGTVTIKSPPLPEGDLTGNVYVGEPIGRDPTSGNLYRIFIAAESDRYGISARFIGNVRADPLTGQLTTTIAETPQVPFTSFAIDFDDGAKAVLSSAMICNPNPAAAEMTPWSGNPAATPTASIAFPNAPGGGPCPKTLGERPFAPTFLARPQGTKAGAFSPVSLNLGRSDGQQEVKGVDITLAPGMTGKLAGIPYCPEGAIAAAANRDGKAEQAASSCPAQSQVGTATIASGTGPSPIQIGGKVFLSGPYRGAPLSLAVLTPATAGPYDLGTVVVRVALFVDPETAQIRAVSDPIPHIYGGAQLSIRSIDVDIDRNDFTLNPTSCGPLATSGILSGGGGDPNSTAAFSGFAVSTPFQTSECGALKFRPKLFTRVFGGKKAMRRGGHAKFRAVLRARSGDANIRRAVLTLPRSLFLDQGNIRTICTRVQLAANACPKGAIYGFARARTPLLDEELAGPVYLTSSDNLLPDLLVDLRGQVNVRLRGVIDSSKARIRNVFATVPDVPVSQFTITMKGGKRGLLENSRDLCAKRSFSFLKFKAQNGKPRKVKRLPLRAPCRKAGKQKSPKN
jgi:hypothetical protein